MQVVILCAGEGTRLRPLTENTPKPLVLIKGKPILSYIFSSLPDETDEVFLIIQEKYKNIFENFISEEKIKIKTNILSQDMSQKGSYFALLTAKDYLDDKFLILNGDDIFLKEDLSLLIEQKDPCYGIVYKKLDNRYRTCDLDEENKKILSFRRQKDSEFGQKIPCFTGAYILNKDFFTYEPVYVGDEAGIPHTLFSGTSDVSYLIMKGWIQINTLEDLKNKG